MYAFQQIIFYDLDITFYAGFHSGDYNQEDALEGFHYVQATIARGRRQYASQAYLRPIASSR